MKILITITLLACLALTAFSQDPNSQRFDALSNSMDNTLTRSNNRLANYDEQMNFGGNSREYSTFKLKFDSISHSMRTVEERIEHMLRSNARPSHIERERNIYATLIRQLEEVKAEYENWMRSIRQ